MRKSSYEEVKRFVKLYRNDSSEKHSNPSPSLQNINIFIGLESRDLRAGVSQTVYTEETKEKSPENSVLQSILNTRQSIGHYQGLRTCGSPIKPQSHYINDMKPKSQASTRSHANSIGNHFNVTAMNTESNMPKRAKESQKSVPSFQSPKLAVSMLTGGYKGIKDAGDLGKIKMFR